MNVLPELSAHEMACPICETQEPRRLYRLSEFSIFQCTGCRQIYLRPLPSPETIDEMFTQLYSSGEGSVPELKSYYDFCYRDEPENPLVRRYEIWLDAVERHRPPGRILDIGCGTGLFLAVARRRGWEPFGIDACDEATTHAREYFGLDIWVGEFEDFADRGPRFDAICGWDIIEHARDPVRLLRSARRCLAPEGVVALSTPNQHSILDLLAGAFYHLSAGRVTGPLEKFYIEQHFLYYTPETLKSSLERAGLEVLELRRELTDLERLTLSPPMRLILHLMFQASRMLGRENRLLSVAHVAPAAV